LLKLEGSVGYLEELEGTGECLECMVRMAAVLEEFLVESIDLDKKELFLAAEVKEE